MSENISNNVRAGKEGPSQRIGPQPVPVIRTELGAAYCADSLDLMRLLVEDESVDLIMTSPPFGLVRKKDYGNADAEEYVAWFRQPKTESQRKNHHEIVISGSKSVNNSPPAGH